MTLQRRDNGRDYRSMTPEQQRRVRFGKIAYAKSEQAKKIFLKVYQAKGDAALAAEMCRRTPLTIHRWYKDDPIFREQYDDYNAAWKVIQEERIKGLVTKSVDVMEAILDKGKDERVKADLAWKIARSEGVVRDKSLVETVDTQNTNITITHIEVVRPSPGPSEVIDGAARHLESGA